MLWLVLISLMLARCNGAQPVRSPKESTPAAATPVVKSEQRAAGRVVLSFPASVDKAAREGDLAGFAASYTPDCQLCVTSYRDIAALFAQRRQAWRTRVMLRKAAGIPPTLTVEAVVSAPASDLADNDGRS